MKVNADNQRQMHQFIVSMERIAAQSAWTGMNRFDSFAPLRVNVAAQWLVDGVSGIQWLYLASKEVKQGLMDSVTISGT